MFDFNGKPINLNERAINKFIIFVWCVSWKYQSFIDEKFGFKLASVHGVNCMRWRIKRDSHNIYAHFLLSVENFEDVTSLILHQQMLIQCLQLNSRINLIVYRILQKGLVRL